MSSSRPRGPLSLLLRVAVFLLVFGVLAEVWLRTVIPASQTPLSYQQDPSTVFRYDPHGPTAGHISHGRLCRDRGAWHVNAAGWNSEVDYQAAASRGRPLVALFGDSYIEGFYTDVDEHVDTYLPEMLPGTDSYAFGLSAWYLEQYVAASRYARERFAPDVLVVFIGRDDVSDSLRENGTPRPTCGRSPRTAPPSRRSPRPTSTRPAARPAWPRSRRSSATCATTPSSRCRACAAGRSRSPKRRPGLRRRPRLRRAAAAPAAAAAAAAAPLESGGAGSPEAQADDAWRDLLPAAEFMIDRLLADHPDTPVVFVAHSDRYLPPEDIAGAPLFPDARAVQEAVRARPQCSFVDLRYAFSRDWAAHGVRFEAADGSPLERVRQPSRRPDDRGRDHGERSARRLRVGASRTSPISESPDRGCPPPGPSCRCGDSCVPTCVQMYACTRRRTPTSTTRFRICMVPGGLASSSRLGIVTRRHHRHSVRAPDLDQVRGLAAMTPAQRELSPRRRRGGRPVALPGRPRRRRRCRTPRAPRPAPSGGACPPAPAAPGR